MLVRQGPDAVDYGFITGIFCLHVDGRERGGGGRKGERKRGKKGERKRKV